MHETLIKTDAVADLKNMIQAYYKDSRTTLTQEVLVPFLLLTLNMF